MADETTLKRPAAEGAFRFEVGQATETGQVRSGNEDSVLCEPVESLDVARRGLFCAVADGMGGHAAGEVASGMAVRRTREAYYSDDTEPADDALRRAIEVANAEVFEAGSKKAGREHMGSTMTAVVVQGERAVVGHVGDSRCYLIRNGRIEQLTRDHSWVAEEVEAGLLTAEEARVHPRRNIITRALGLRPDIEVDIYPATVEPGSILLLCSDGLHGLVRDEEMLDRTTRLTPQHAVDSLIALANERGGPDNISAVVVKLEPVDELETTPGIPVPDEDWTPPALATLDAASAADSTQRIRATPPPQAAVPEQVTPTGPDLLSGPSAGQSADTPARRRRGPAFGLLLGVVLGLLLLGAGIAWFLIGSSGF